MFLQGDVVYVNYGRVEDHEYLEEHNISVKGKIVLARYGKIFRGDKVPTGSTLSPRLGPSLRLHL